MARKQKKEKPVFVVQRRIYLNNSEYCMLDKKMNICNKMYNTAVKHYKQKIQELYEDVWYQYCLEQFRKATDEDIAESWAYEIYTCMDAYDLNEYKIHAYMGYQKVHAFNKGIGINIVQKLGTSLYESIKKAVFRKTKIHYRKKGSTCSFEDKKATTGIIYNPKNGTVKVMGVVLKLKAIRETDVYLMEAMTRKIKYCRIVRKPFKSGYKYFLQLIMDGTAPKKFMKGYGKCGVDEGVSTVNIYNDKEADFHVLAENIERYEKQVLLAQRKYERRRRINNPECFNEDGTIKKGCKFTVHTKGMMNALYELKNAYRLKSEYINISQNKYVNHLIQSADFFIKEPMDYRKLAKRAKDTARQNKASTIKNKDGSEKQVYKFKKKKRFGKSIGRRSPSRFNLQLERKAKQYDCSIVNVNSREYKASQYDHVTREATKPKLSDRSKSINGHLVQRDLYSSFLLYCILDEKHINFNECELLFDDFLEKQAVVVDKILKTGDKTKNFGIEKFQS